MISAESYTGLMTDGAHIWFEITWEAITLAIGLVIGRYLMPRWKERFHRDLDEAHGIEHARDGKAHILDTLLAENEQYKAVLQQVADYSNVNAAAYRQEKERADALQETLARELRKNS